MPPVLWMGLIFYASSLQKVALSENYWISFAFFKTLHLIEYGILFLFWHFALKGRANRTKEAVIIAIVYGIIDEIHQIFVPTREGRLRDVLIDILGVLVFWKFVLARIENLVKNIRNEKQD